MSQMNPPESPEKNWKDRRIEELGDWAGNLHGMVSQSVVNNIAQGAELAALRDGLKKCASAMKQKLDYCRKSGDCADIVLMPGEVCSEECSALTQALAAAQALLSGAALGEPSELDRVRLELAALQSLLNTPEVESFDKGVPLEAAHQVQRWTAEHDAGKAPQDWFWLIGYLAGKALHSHVEGDIEKAKHRVIATAAALRNWHAHIRSGESAMRPGIADPDSPTGTADDAIPSATVEAIPEAIHPANSQYPRDGKRWTLEQARWQLGDASPDTREFWAKAVAELEDAERLRLQREYNAIHARTERPIQAGDTVRHKTQGWEARVISTNLATAHHNPHEIDLAYQGLPEDRRMANDPRSTAENNAPAAEAGDASEIVELRNPRTDPQSGDKVDHLDGGLMYVNARTPSMVLVSRRPTHQGDECWMRLGTFTKVAR